MSTREAITSKNFFDKSCSVPFPIKENVKKVKIIESFVHKRFILSQSKHSLTKVVQLHFLREAFKIKMVKISEISERTSK